MGVYVLLHRCYLCAFFKAKLFIKRIEIEMIVMRRAGRWLWTHVADVAHAIFTFHAFVAPVIRARAGLPPEAVRTIEAEVPVRVPAELGRKEPPLGIVHRIDKETSGLVLFARSLAAKLDLKNQFRVHSVRRRYRAIVHGSVGRAR